MKFIKLLLPLMFAAGILAAQETQTIDLDKNVLIHGNDSLTQISVTVSCDAATNFLLINSVLPTFGEVLCADIKSIQVDGTEFPDTFDLSQVRKKEFKNLRSVKLNGNGHNDTIDGSKLKDKIDGGPGDDLIRGKGGNDVLNGRSGNDRVFGNAGNDKIRTHSGNDKAVGGPGNDRINTSSGNDNINGGGGDDRISAGSGNDRINGGKGNDTASTGSGNDRVKNVENNGGGGSNIPNIDIPFF